jgi:hypothetical protein
MVDPHLRRRVISISRKLEGLLLIESELLLEPRPRFVEPEAHRIDRATEYLRGLRVAELFPQHEAQDISVTGLQSSDCRLHSLAIGSSGTRWIFDRDPGRRLGLEAPKQS